MVTNTHPTPRATTATAPRAASAREAQTLAEKKHVTRMDPQEVQRQEAIARSEADPSAPKPQVGLSSSQLNTATPAMKEAATKEAKALPTNTDPKHGVSESKAGSAQKKFEKAHEA